MKMVMPHQHSHQCLHCVDDAQDKTKQTRLLIALLLITGFAGVELMVGLLSQSLVLIADAGHLFSDGVALGLAFVALWLPQWLHQRRSIALRGEVSPPLAKAVALRAKLPTISLDSADTILSANLKALTSPPTLLAPEGTLSNKPFHTLEFWAAFINSLALSVMALWLAWEAIHRLQTLPDIASLPMLLTAIMGVTVNGINIIVLHPSIHNDLNLKAAFLHVIADALSSIGVIVAAIVVTTLHWYWIDGVISLLIAGLILLNTIPITLQSLKVQILRKGYITQDLKHWRR